MERDAIMAVIERILGDIAPEVDVAALDPSADLQTEADLDSMDFLNVVAAIDTELSISIPERDYPSIRSLDALVGYLGDRASSST